MLPIKHNSYSCKAQSILLPLFSVVHYPIMLITRVYIPSSYIISRNQSYPTLATLRRRAVQQAHELAIVWTRQRVHRATIALAPSTLETCRVVAKTILIIAIAAYPHIRVFRDSTILAAVAE
jgi:hypothetical protein